MPTRTIGDRVARGEDARLVVGRGVFIDDIRPPGALHAAMVRSPFAHAHFTGVDVESALAAAPHVLERELRVERSAATPLEGRGVVAIPDEFGHLLVYDTSQAPSTIRAGLSGLLGLAEYEVDVVAPDVGGGFG